MKYMYIYIVYKQIWYTNILEYYSTIKRNKIHVIHIQTHTHTPQTTLVVSKLFISERLLNSDRVLMSVLILAPVLSWEPWS